jgi:hypothetical protein
VGVMSRARPSSRAMSVVSSSTSSSQLGGCGEIQKQKQLLIELREKRSEIAKKRKERESYLLYLRSLLASSSLSSSRQTTAPSDSSRPPTRKRQVVHVTLGDTWNLMELKEREIVNSLQQLGEYL